MKKSILLTLSIVVFYSASAQSLRELYQAGTKAYEEKNYQVFKEKMYSIDTMRPNYPPVVYNLAGGYALTGEIEKSIKTLNQYILMNATQDFSKDTDFDALANNSDFKMIVEKQKELTKEVAVEVAYEFPILQSHSECITYSPKQKSFFLGGVRDGKIWKIRDGKEPAVWADSPANSWAVMGLEISKDGKTLWACTSGMTNYEGLAEEDKNKASVLKYDLKKGTLLETFAVPANHVFGDMITDSKGNAYISDGTANQLYWVSKQTGKLEVFADLDETLFNLQGLTFNADESAMYLSDYIDGIYKLDMASKKIQKLSVPDNVLLKGIDGLYFIDNKLIGLHNGTTPNRVMTYTLNTDGTAIVSKAVEAQAGVLGEPTQGTIIDGQLFFIANSPWAAYDREGNFSPGNGPAIIGKTSIK
ncbi:MAG: hypothetical protein ABJP45_07275 [Cyclobacteriaceae bacterium]